MSISMSWMKGLKGLKVVTASACLWAVAAVAQSTPFTYIDLVSPTGSTGNGNPDPNWQVVALPTDFTPAPSTPYASLTFSGTSPNTIPGLWLGSTDNNGGGSDGKWIGVRESPASLFNTNVGVGYSMIYATKIESHYDGPVIFQISNCADNAVEYILDGTIVADAITPSIIDGQDLGGVQRGALAVLRLYQGWANLTIGQHTLYAVVTDLWSTTANSYGSTGLLVSSVTVVPEPSTYAMAGLAFVTVALCKGRRRFARR